MRQLIGITLAEVGRKMADVGCAERLSRIEKLLIWAQESLLAHQALGKMADNAAELGLHDGAGK